MELSLAILAATLAAMVAWVVQNTRAELREARRDWHDRAERLHAALTSVVRELGELRGRMGLR